MACKTDASGIKSIPPGPISLSPAATVSAPAPDPKACPSPDCQGESSCSGGTASASCTCEQNVLPYCPPGLTDADGRPLCPQCLPPEAVMIRATPRDPYYIDDLAKGMDEGDTTRTIRIHVSGNIPVVRPVAFRHSALQGTFGIPNTVRADIETHELEHQAINMYATIPTDNGERREVAVVDRFSNRWVIFTSDVDQAAVVEPKRISPAYFVRGRGVRPWWKTDYPDGTASSGLG